MIENVISEKIIVGAIEVHKSIGPGLLISAYFECLFYKLQMAGLKIEKQKPLPSQYTRCCHWIDNYSSCPAQLL